jgi:hypothetical protein
LIESLVSLSLSFFLFFLSRLFLLNNFIYEHKHRQRAETPSELFARVEDKSDDLDPEETLLYSKVTIPQMTNSDPDHSSLDGNFIYRGPILFDLSASGKLYPCTHVKNMGKRNEKER